MTNRKISQRQTNNQSERAKNKINKMVSCLARLASQIKGETGDLEVGGGGERTVPAASLDDVYSAQLPRPHALTQPTETWVETSAAMTARIAQISIAKMAGDFGFWIAWGMLLVFVRTSQSVKVSLQRVCHYNCLLRFLTIQCVKSIFLLTIITFMLINHYQLHSLSYHYQ